VRKKEKKKKKKDRNHRAKIQIPAVFYRAAIKSDHVASQLV